jgi:hypothetical protein
MIPKLLDVYLCRITQDFTMILIALIYSWDRALPSSAALEGGKTVLRRDLLAIMSCYVELAYLPCSSSVEEHCERVWYAPFVTEAGRLGISSTLNCLKTNDKIAEGRTV